MIERIEEEGGESGNVTLSFNLEVAEGLPLRRKGREEEENSVKKKNFRKIVCVFGARECVRDKAIQRKSLNVPGGGGGGGPAAKEAMQFGGR